MSDLESSRSPAEALRQQLLQALDDEDLSYCSESCKFGDAGAVYDRDTDRHILSSEQVNAIISFVTAYAATVEREAVEDTIWKIMSPKTEGLFDGGDLFIKRKPIEDAIIGMIGYEKYKALQEAVDDRLAALQGPQEQDDTPASS